MNGKKILIGIVALVVIVVGGLYVVIASLDVNEYRDVIAEEAEKATGRKLTLGGELKLNVSLSPSITASDITFANAGWGSRPEMVKLRDVSVEVALMPLISGNIQVKRLVLSGLDVLLETNSKGTPNWAFADAKKAAKKADKDADDSAAGEAGDAALPTVNLVELRDINLTWKDGQSGDSKVVKISKLTGEADSASSPLAFDLVAALNDSAITAAGKLGPLAELADNDKPWPLDLTLKAGGATIKVSGSIANPMAASGMALKLAISGNSVADLSALAGASLPPIGPYNISGNLKGSPANISLSGLAVKMGGSDLAGKVQVKVGKSKPVIAATLKSKLLNVDDFTGPKQEKAAEAAPAKEGDGGEKRIFSADPLPLDALSSIDVAANIVIAKLMASGIVVQGIDLAANIKNGTADVNLKKGSVSGGALSARIKADGRKGKSGVTAKFKATDVDVGKMLKEMKVTDLLDAKVSTGADIKGKGTSVRAIMAGLNGNVDVVSTNAIVGSKYLDLIAADLLTALVPGGDKKDETKVNCFINRFEIKNGIANNSAFLFDTARVVITGGGKINLQDETIELDYEPKPKDASLLSLAVPIQVRGTLAAPEAGPNTAAVAAGVAIAVVSTAINPLGLLIPLISGGSDDKNPCVAAMKGGGKAAAKPAGAQVQPAPEKKEKSGGIGGLLNSLTDSIKK
ncbi:MAG: AsmA family protein [Alphaproteobacteria bacterium]|jgi:AsmA family protein|nr:AsmA family protein [Alphaproteobacteria bacterium]MBT4019929.1 AsmA family protein [Alphaproteobacteria bacterium]MBT4965815.1 AsmA family protein [Alphaproteobacteria bacterium]MBT5919361.1 AsmA family protein [Alphaproteobacteria bacterium]MBT6385122.1 AsmA family protein [Alphaproteobacteria bacterium]